MSGFVDLHCHWVHEIDDGARTIAESRAMLQGLADLGFAHVVATPHMRPGMFDNTSETIRRAFQRAHHALKDLQGLPQVSLGSEHFFDEQVLSALRRGEGLPYRDETAVLDEKPRFGGAVLVEFHDLAPRTIIEQQLFRLQAEGFTVVFAHPERYRATWGQPALIEAFVEKGAITLLDTAALVGKYGSRPQAAAQALLEEGLYHAACSDAHRPGDLTLVEEGMNYIREQYGNEEIELLFGKGPRDLLRGKAPSL